MRKFSITLIITFTILLMLIAELLSITKEHKINYGTKKVINKGGVYFLRENISGSFLIGIKIIANDTVLDCKGHHITGESVPGSIGIFIEASNVTIKNCHIQRVERGIWNSLGVCCNKIFNNTISYLNTTLPNQAGIGVFGEYLLIKSNKIFNTSVTCDGKRKGRGIWGFINHSIIKGNFIYNICGHGISLSSHLPPYTIINNTIEKNIIENIISSPPSAGIRNAEGVAFSTIKENIIKNVPFGIRLDKGDMPGNSPRFV